VTKSVTALVLGVAVDRGIIADIDQSVLSFFPDYADLRTPEKDRITIRHLLTMSMASPGTCVVAALKSMIPGPFRAFSSKPRK
jgi:CubicO group peptidase (beta-lactamase class C family)